MPFQLFPMPTQVGSGELILPTADGGLTKLSEIFEGSDVQLIPRGVFRDLLAEQVKQMLVEEYAARGLNLVP